MNAKRAKRLRKKVYPPGQYGRVVLYVKDPKSGTIYATNLRRAFQDAKHTIIARERYI